MMLDKSPRPQSRSSAGKSKGISVTASGGKNPGANLKPSTRPGPMGGAASGDQYTRQYTPPHMMSGSKDKAPPSRTPKAEIKGYLSKVAREDRATEKSNYKTLDRAMGGADAKATKQDLAAARQDKMSKSSAPSKSPRPMRSPVKKAMGGMVGYKDGGCVMAGRGGKYKGQM